MKDQLKKLLEKATDEERSEIELLQRAVAQTKQAYENGFAASKKRDWDAAVEGLESAIVRIESRYIPKEPPYKNRVEVLKQLTAKGYKISKSRLYKDSDNGLLTVQPDGAVHRADVDSYILRADLRKTESSEVEAGGFASEEAQERIRKLRNQNRDLEFKYSVEQGKCLLKEDVRQQVAMKIGALEAGLKYMLRVRAVDWVDAVGGNAAKKQILIDLAEADIDDLLNEFGMMDDISVIVEKRTTAGEAEILEAS